MKRRRLLAAAAATLAACATVPPPEPARAFGEADLYALDPAALRAAVLSDPRVVFQAVDIEVLAAADRYVFRLQQALAPDPRLPPAPAGRAWQVFAPAADQMTALATVRQLLLDRPRGAAAGIKVNISAQPALVPADLMAALPLRIDLLVDNREGWFRHSEALLDLRRP